MAGALLKKRGLADGPSQRRPAKKQKRPPQYNSDDDDLDNAIVDDVASLSDSDHADSDSDAHVNTVAPPVKSLPRKQPTRKPQASDSGEDDDDEEDDHGTSDDQDDDDQDADESAEAGPKRQKSKRNDPSAFSTSLQKILSTGLSNAKKHDAILSRSVDAQKASRDIVDAGLEAKARKLLRDKKLLAQEKGRVKDVMMGGADEDTSTGEILQTERRLRKTAHKGVIMWFRAVREAQEKAHEAEGRARGEGFVGTARRKEKVQEMTKEAFLDTLARGGGKLRKGGLEEA
ncbi:Rrp15p-domain-containing protein [Xylariaceae sp. FL1272]|nr:Rrp15p-domain-containing protein [Xylariaceae sp. FL1272]